MTHLSLHSNSYRIEQGVATLLYDPYLSKYEKKELKQSVEHVVEVDSNTLSASYQYSQAFSDIFNERKE